MKESSPHPRLDSSTAAGTPALRIQTPLRICFVTGTRAEFGLMQTALTAMRDHPNIRLQIIATGMHLSPKHGMSIKNILADGWTVHAKVPWKSSDETENAIATGKAIAGIVAALNRLQTDIVLVVGDRVEAFAAAAAGHIAGKIVAHVHGGDRALGQVDDALRHAITKLAHIHFPATAASKARIIKLGEDPWRVHRVGSPGIDGIATLAARQTLLGSYALLVLHPTDTDEDREYDRASLVLSCIKKIGIDQIVIIYPNNDPGSAGIIRCWEADADDIVVHRDVPRSRFLALMRDAAVLIGNSSSGIIEAASFGTPVVDVGPRQSGRERSGNAVNVAFSKRKILQALRRIWNDGEPIRYPKRNVYGGDGAGAKMARVLGDIKVDLRLQRKLISY